MLRWSGKSGKRTEKGFLCKVTYLHRNFFRTTDSNKIYEEKFEDDLINAAVVKWIINSPGVSLSIKWLSVNGKIKFFISKKCKTPPKKCTQFIPVVSATSSFVFTCWRKIKIKTRKKPTKVTLSVLAKPDEAFSSNIYECPPLFGSQSFMKISQGKLVKTLIKK